MRKIKKIFAVLLALTMLMGMSVTTFATEDKATITVTGVETGTVISYAHIIKPDTTKDTGWTFVSTDIESVYVAAYKADHPTVQNPTGQDVLEALANANRKTGTNESDVAWVKAAISNATSEVTSWTTLNTNVTSWEVDDAGIYIVKPVESTFNYLAMAAYVGFEPVDKDGHAQPTYPLLQDVTLGAKGSKRNIEKTNTDLQNVVAIGDTVSYELVTTVPYIENTGRPVREYYVIDNIKGAKYTGYPATGTSLSGVTVAFKTATGTENLPSGITPTATVVTPKSGYEYSFKLDLTGLVASADNTYAGREIIIKYSAIVEKVTVENKAESNDGTDKVNFGEGEDKVFTGQITLTKKAEKAENGKDIKLAGAGFEVKIGSGNPLAFVKDSDGVYTYVKDANVRTVGEGESQKEVTGSQDSPIDVYRIVSTKGGDNKEAEDYGTVVVKGLDLGTYSFHEVIAPVGYSLNETDATATLKVEKDSTTQADIPATAVVTAVTDMTDTTLSALPSTGGIGTTIFTVGGCAIMILAAGLYFTLRRKTEK